MFFKKIRKTQWLSFILLIGIAVSNLAYADQVRVTSDVWGTFRDEGRDGSYDTITDSLAVEISENNFFNYSEAGAWEVDLSDLPAFEITSITLEILNSDGTNFDPYDLKHYIGDGVISIDDATAGALLVSEMSRNIGAIIEVDVTDLIMDPATLAAGYAGFSVEYTDPVKGYFRRKTIRGAEGELYPTLRVEFTPVPLPGSAWLLLSALGLLGWNKTR